MDSPILLWGVIEDLAVGQILGIGDSSRLQNPFKTAMFIDEVRMRISPTPAVAVPGTTAVQQYQAVFLAEFFLGEHALTNGFIPFGNFSRLLQPDQVNQGAFTWKLPKPLYIPPGEYMSAKIWNLPSGYVRDVEIAYAGRSLPSDFPVPKNIHVPWVANFNIPNQARATTTSVESAESDLVNPFDEEMYVQRFIGRGNCNEATQSTQNFDVEFNASTSLLTTVRAVDSEGRILIRDATPFTNVFFYGDRSWTVNTVLKPKGFYKFFVDQDYANISTPSTLTQGANISMIGYRELETRKFYRIQSRGRCL